MEQIARDQLRTLIDDFCKLTGRTPGRISELACGDVGFRARLDDPDKGFNIRTHTRAMRWFTENWPDGESLPPALTGWLDFQDTLPNAAAGCNSAPARPPAAVSQEAGE